MQTEKAIEAEQKTVDIDTTGPDTEVEISTEEKNTDSTPAEATEETSVEPVAAEPTQEEGEKEQEAAQETTTENTEAKKELDDYSDSVKKRIAKLTKRMREAERREEAATLFAKSLQSKQKTYEQRLSKLDKGYVSEMETRIETSLEAAKAKLSKARLDGDIDSEVAAQSEISKLGYEQAKLAEIKAQPEQEVKLDNQPETAVRNQETEAAFEQQKQPTPDPKAEAWAEKNSWFGSDEPMTYTAFALHKKLVEEEGFDPKSDEYYSEIDKRIRLEFPHKFGTTETKSTEEKPTQIVASAARSSKPGRKIVRLTSSQRAIAKKLGVPLEEYAKQLNLITKE